MEGYRKSSHAVHRCEYHFVWVPKYRYQVLVKDIKPRLKEVLTELCEWLDILIIEGAIRSDHIHMYVSVPPKYAPSHVMKVLKGPSNLPKICSIWQMKETKCGKTPVAVCFTVS